MAYNNWFESAEGVSCYRDCCTLTTKDNVRTESEQIWDAAHYHKQIWNAIHNVTLPNPDENGNLSKESVKEYLAEIIDYTGDQIELGEGWEILAQIMFDTGIAHAESKITETKGQIELPLHP